ncbi:MAG: hypothetical protein EYC68_09685 [Chloroflexota bacterium]|nr:MAG: hypothetical protein EYC68_09685 [Chloroflexota bacterium]
MLQVWLLGQFGIHIEGKRVVIPARAAQSLFAFLILNVGTPHRREKLAGMLWPELSDENARHNLRHELWRLRKALGAIQTLPAEYFLAEEFAIQFNPNADYWLDVAQLERAPAPDDSVGDLIGRVALYRGELLPGFYDDWVAPERDRVQAIYETRMRELLEQLIAGQHWQTAVHWSEKWIALGQTPEAAYRALMLAYAMFGDRAQCAATYERCAKVLSQELGIEPSDETRALYENTMRGVPITHVSLNAPRIVVGSKQALYDEPPAPGEPPFKGLDFFDEPDANLFFGREQLVSKIARELEQQRFLAVVVGASGSGKSSVVRAGLVPALRATTDDGRRTTNDWRVFVMTPTAHPLEALATVLTRDQSLTMTAQLMDDLAREPRSLRLYLRRLTTDDSLQDPRPLSAVRRRFLLVVDQFEELFTLCHDELEREQFIDNLVNALSQTTDDRRQTTDLTLVLTIRADFYAHLAEYPELRDLVAKQQEYIGPMNAEELRRAIEEPANQGSWEFEPGLVDLILRDVGDEPGALPLLSHALLETWKRRSGHWMTLKGYHDAGGVRGAIAHTAETTYQQLSPEQQTIARNIFLRLTELGEGTEDTRRRAEFGELEIYPEPGRGNGDQERGQVRQVLTLLADARLITTSEHSAEVAHEALIREWPRLREWLNDDREGLMLHRHLIEATHEWELMERDASVLYRGARLAQAQEFAASYPNALNAGERAFLETSKEQETREERARDEQQQRELAQAQKLAEEQEQRANVETKRAEEQTRANKRLRQRALFLVGALGLALVLAGIALFLGDTANRNARAAAQNAAQAESHASAAETERLNAEKEKRAATARELAAAAVANLEVDPERSILLALQAVAATNAQDHRILPEAYDALNRAVQSSRVKHTLTGHEASPQHTAFSPDGTRLATNSADGTIRVWDVKSGQQLLQLPITKEFFDRLFFSKDGSQLATVDVADEQSLAVKIFDLRTGNVTKKTPLPISPKQWIVSAVNPDWKRVAVFTSETSTPQAEDVITKNGKVTVWDIESGELLETFETGSSGGYDVAYSSDGAQIATAMSDGTAQVWNAQTGALVTKLVGHDGPVIGIAYSGDGTRIATGSQDQTARVWDAKTGKEIFKLTGTNGYIYEVSFSRDSSRLLTVSADHNGKVWDMNTGKELMTLPGHTAFIYHGTLASDGLLAATTSLDGTIRIWDLTPSHQFLTIPTTGPLSSVDWSIGYLVYSPNGKQLATGLRDGRVKVWDATNGQEIFTFDGHTGPVHRVAFSPDGFHLASASSDGTAKEWDLVAGKEAMSFAVQNGAAISLSYSPDGKRIAAGDGGGIIHIWDTNSGKELTSLGTLKTNPVFGVAFSPDGKELAASFRDGTVTNWDLATGKQFFVFNKLNEGVFTVAFSPDGSRIAFASDPIGSQVLDAKTGQVIYLVGGTRNAANQIVYSPDGKLLATAQLGENGAKLWDAATGAEVLTLTGNPIFTHSIAFSPDGSRLAVATDEDIRVLLIRADDLIALAKTRATRSLTPEECRRYLHAQECPKE